MKILHILYASYPNISGSSARSRDIILSQLKIGIQPIIITSPFQNACTKGKELEIINNVKYYRTFSGFDDELSSEIKSNILLQIRKGFRLFRFSYDVYKVAKKENVVLLHAHSMFFCAIAAKVSSLLLRVPCVYEVRSLWEERYKNMGLFSRLRFSIFTIVETISMVLSNELIVICQNLKKHLLSRYFLSRKRIHVVPNAIDITRISTSSTIKDKSPHEINFAYIGSLSQIEGIDLLINAFHKLKANGFRNKLIIIGNGPEQDNLKKLSEGNELIENRDAVLLDEIDSVYASIDVVINPRRKSLLSDTVTPLKPLEAIMFRKLIMASNIGGMRELLEHNKTAILFKPDSINAIFEAIIHTINRDDIILIIDNAVRHLSRHRSWNINAENYLRIYTALIKSYRR